MKRIALIGGETHVAEITRLCGSELEVAAVSVRPEQVPWARAQFNCEVTTDFHDLLGREDIDVFAVATENDMRAEAVLAALRSGHDVIVDKPLAITIEEQEEIESALEHDRWRRLLMLLTLRGRPLWMGMRQVVQSGKIGRPAFVHIRMAVQLNRERRPPWFLDVRRSGGMFLDLLIHGLDQVEWLTGRRVIAVTANMGNLGDAEDVHLRDHAAVYCELDDGTAAVVEGQRMLPATKTSDYRVTIAGTGGYADLVACERRLLVTSAEKADEEITTFPPAQSIVADWLRGGDLVPQATSLRANRLALLATVAATRNKRVETYPLAR